MQILTTGHLDMSNCRASRWGGAIFVEGWMNASSLQVAFSVILLRSVAAWTFGIALPTTVAGASARKGG